MRIVQIKTDELRGKRKINHQTCPNTLYCRIAFANLENSNRYVYVRLQFYASVTLDPSKYQHSRAVVRVTCSTSRVVHYIEGINASCEENKSNYYSPRIRDENNFHSIRTSLSFSRRTLKNKFEGGKAGAAKNIQPRKISLRPFTGCITRDS